MVELSGINWVHVMNYIPFVGLTVKSEETPFLTRMAEAAIIAVATGLFTMWITIPKIQEQVSNLSLQVSAVHEESKERMLIMSNQMDKVEGKVDKLNDKVDKNTEQQRTDLDTVKRDLWSKK